MHDVAVGRRWIHLRQVLRHRLAGARHDIAVQETSVQQMLQHDRHAADAINVGHVILPARLGVGDVRHLRSDAIEVVEVECDTCLVGDSQEVQHCVRTSTKGIEHGDRVLERLLGHDVAWINTETSQVDDGLASATRIIFAALVNSRRRCSSGKAHPDRFSD